MVEMELVGVRVELPSNTPIVLLREVDGDERMLPIFIGGPEATAIALALDEVETPRPMTHDLLKTVLEDLGATLERVIVTDLQEGTFFAELQLTRTEGDMQLSCRPSDAIALAVRTGSPIFAKEAVLEEVAFNVDDEADGPGAEQVVEEFKEFIENVDPDDFAS